MDYLDWDKKKICLIYIYIMSWFAYKWNLTKNANWNSFNSTNLLFSFQECLVQWMRYSRKEYCELCSHKFSFMPIYAPDMPRRLPAKDILGGLLSSVLKAVKHWIHYTLVAIAWLGIVPLLGYRIYKCLFTGTLDSVSFHLLPHGFCVLKIISKYVTF